ncbi:hypothetical protein [Hyphomicrobium sp.]|jgi:hypothetical protein|uniref:hypothetical protein n=1 Tax=Hyphomicrobium sp. TaxID=82 RepID=UPI00356ACCD1
MTRQRLLLLGLLIWALAMILPDFARVVRPLASFGFYSDSDGLIYDVSGPFDAQEQSPAWKAGIREGDRLDFSRMRCIPYDRDICASTISAVGGNEYVLPGRTATFELLPNGSEGARTVHLTADPRPANWLVRFVLLLDQAAGIAVVLAATWLVWTKPGPMSWGFFLYAIWFNPGQAYEFYAQLQRWPLVLIMQNILGCIAQAAGYVGLLIFVMRAPTDTLQPEWARVERLMPWLGAVIAVALMGAYGSSFGFHTELLSRATILFGIIVSVAAVTILLMRRQTLSPKDNQRLRWVMWGCLIGLPAFVIADLNEYTTLLTDWDGFFLPEDAAGLLYLINGVLCLFVVEAVRRQRVVNVAIPLRRVTVLALMTSLPALLLHQQAEQLHELVELPSWGWLLIGAIILFVIGRLHEWAVELADDFFNRSIDRAEEVLDEAILEAKTAGEIDRILSIRASNILRLSSAVTFRRTDTGFRRLEDGTGWSGGESKLGLDDKDLGNLLRGAPCVINEAAAEEAGFPAGLDMPILAIPATSRVHCFAVTLYGPHESGTDIDSNERQTLQNLGRHAADAYARLENEELRRALAELQEQVGPHGALA